MPPLVYSRPVSGPATHAIVIGVGHYPHLIGGGGRAYANPEMMEQISSPPVSARDLARWLVENYHCPDRPLSSVRLLVSDPTPTPFSYRRDGKKVTRKPGAGSFAQVATAIRAWRAAGESDPDNLLLFYFCGHGLGSELNLSLLMSDYGADQHDPLAAALDFGTFRLGMQECAAREQCYFVDACRASSSMFDRGTTHMGQAIFRYTGNAPMPGGRSCRTPTFYSALVGSQAYAHKGQRSVFTDALLQALAGSASDNPTGPWIVDATRVHESLNHLMEVANNTLNLPMEQATVVDGLRSVRLNTLESPKVPVEVLVIPEQAHALANLRCQGALQNGQRSPAPSPWRFFTPAGAYDFHATFAAGQYTNIQLLNESVRPPYWAKPLKVS